MAEWHWQRNKKRKRRMVNRRGGRTGRMKREELPVDVAKIRKGSGRKDERRKTQRASEKNDKAKRESQKNEKAKRKVKDEGKGRRKAMIELHERNSAMRSQ